jgi:hypothetical protein
MKKKDEVVSPPIEDDPWISLKKSLELFPDDFMENRNQPGIQIREYLFD